MYILEDDIEYRNRKAIVVLLLFLLFTIQSVVSFDHNENLTILDSVSEISGMEIPEYMGVVWRMPLPGFFANNLRDSATDGMLQATLLIANAEYISYRYAESQGEELPQEFYNLLEKYGRLVRVADNNEFRREVVRNSLEVNLLVDDMVFLKSTDDEAAMEVIDEKMVEATEHVEHSVKYITIRALWSHLLFFFGWQFINLIFSMLRGRYWPTTIKGRI